MNGWEARRLGGWEAWKPGSEKARTLEVGKPESREAGKFIHLINFLNIASKHPILPAFQPYSLPAF